MTGVVRVDVRTDIQRTIAEFRAFRGDVDKATYRALNRAVDKVGTESGREIRKEYNVKAAAIRNALSKQRAYKGHLFARLVVEGVRLGLIEFAARAVNPWNVKGRRHVRGGGVSLKIKVRGGRRLYRGAFITAATANNYLGGGSAGMKQVWLRRTAERDSLRVLRGISVPQAFANQAVLDALEKVAVETFNKNFAQQIRYLSGVL